MHSGAGEVVGGDAQTLLDNRTSGRPNPRAAAAQAAEERMKAAQARGTNKSNPNRGLLAAKVEASKSAARTAEAQQPERLVFD